MLSPIFFFFLISILNNGAVNSINKIGAIGDPYGNPIFTGSWFFILSLSLNIAVLLLKK